jgi:hypothetical protein
LAQIEDMLVDVAPVLGTLHFGGTALLVEGIPQQDKVIGPPR